MRRNAPALLALTAVERRSHPSAPRPAPVPIDSGTITLALPVDSLGRSAHAPPVPDEPCAAPRNRQRTTFAAEVAPSAHAAGGLRPPLAGESLGGPEGSAT